MTPHFIELTPAEWAILGVVLAFGLGCWIGERTPRPRLIFVGSVWARVRRRFGLRWK